MRTVMKQIETIMRLAGRFSIILGVCFVFANCALAQSLTIGPYSRFGGAGNEQVYFVTCTSNSSVFVAGIFLESLTLNPAGPVIQGDGQDLQLFFSWFENAEEQWTRIVSGDFQNGHRTPPELTGLFPTTEGGIVVSINAHSGLVVDSEIYSHNGGYVMKLHNTGEVAWVHLLSESAITRPSDVLLVGQSNTVVTGSFSGPWLIGDSLFTGANAHNGKGIFLASVSEEGDIDRFRHIRPVRGGYGGAVYESNGDIIVTASTGGDVLIGSAVIERSHQSFISDYFIGRFNSDLELIWGKLFGKQTVMSSNVALDSQGDIIMVALFDDQVVVDGSVVLDYLGQEYVPTIVKISASGDVQWVKRLSESDMLVKGVVIDANDNIHIAVVMSEDFVSGAEVVQVSSGRTQAILTFDQSGSFLQFTVVGSPSVTSARTGLSACGSDNSMVVAGNYDRAFYTGSETLAHMGSADFFIAPVQVGGAVAVEEELTPRGKSLEVYPVPADDILTIKAQFDLSEKVIIKLFSLDGRLVLAKTLTGVQIQSGYNLNVTSITAGLYVVQLYSRDQSNSVLVVIQ